MWAGGWGECRIGGQRLGDGRETGQQRHGQTAREQGEGGSSQATGAREKHLEGTTE